MVNYIYELCKVHDCMVDLRIGADGPMSVTVYGKRTDHIIIGANWSEVYVKDRINDVIRRACYD